MQLLMMDSASSLQRLQCRKERERVCSAAETAKEKEGRMRQQLEMEQDVLLKGSRRGR